MEWRKLKAIICSQPGELRLVERPEPNSAPDEVLVRIHRVGLCGTDYHIFKGNQPFLAYPRVMGHELAGVVVSAPAGCGFAVGQTITINPYLACGKCRSCQRGKPNCCRNVTVLGVHADGGMCDLISVPVTAVLDATGLSLDQAAMVEFLAIGAHAVARSGIGQGDRALVVGAGPIGIGTAIFAQLAGANVTLMDSRLARLKIPREQLGMDQVIVANSEALETLSQQTDGEFFDVVYDATGAIAAMCSGLSYVGHGGTYVLISVVKEDLKFPDPEFHKRETTLMASRNALSDDFARVIAAIKSGAIPTSVLHTHSIAAEDMPREVPRLIDEAEDVIKAIAVF